MVNFEIYILYILLLLILAILFPIINILRILIRSNYKSKLKKEDKKLIIYSSIPLLIFFLPFIVKTNLNNIYYLFIFKHHLGLHFFLSIIIILILIIKISFSIKKSKENLIIKTFLLISYLSLSLILWEFTHQCAFLSCV